MPRLLGALVFPTILLTAVQAASITLANYNFVGGSKTSVVTVNGTTPGDFLIGTNGAISSSTQLAYFTSNITPASEASALDVSNLNFFGFTITVDADSALNLDRLQFRTMFNGNAALDGKTATYIIQSSIGGFGIGKPILNTFTETYQGSAGTTNQRTITLSAAEFQNVTGGVEFRIYVYDDSNATNQYVRIGNVGLIGEVTAIPEPAAVAVIVGAVGLLAALGLRRK